MRASACLHRSSSRRDRRSSACSLSLAAPATRSALRALIGERECNQGNRSGTQAFLIRTGMVDTRLPLPHQNIDTPERPRSPLPESLKHALLLVMRCR